MKIALMQPTFNPWLGYFDLIDYVDKFIFFDTVQLNQQSWQTRNKIKIQSKESLVTLPIQKNKSKTELLIKDVLLDFRKFDFRKKLIKTLDQNYKKSKCYNEVNEFINEIVLYDTDFLSKYNINIIKRVCEKLSIDTDFVTLSETDYVSSVNKGEQVIDIVNYFQGTEYISPVGSKDYLEDTIKSLQKIDFKVEYQHYKPIEYEQLGDKFIPYLGVFDILYNEGFSESLLKIKKGRSFKGR